jgi:hypothetical protein
MADMPNLADVEQRAKRYWNVDGLPELVMGLLWIVWGGSFLMGQSLPRGPVWNVFWKFTPALLACSGFAAVWAIKRLKARITFPRAGYVEWNEPTRAQRLSAAAVALVSAALLVVLIQRGRDNGLEPIIAPGIGVLFSLAFLVASLTQRAPHLLALAGVSLLLGLAFRASTLGWDAMNWMLVWLGAATIVLGTVRLWLFVRTHPLERSA